MSQALPSFVVPRAGEVLAGRAFSLPAPAAVLGESGDVLAARSRSHLPALTTLYATATAAAPTYAQNKLVGRGASSGTGIAEEITVGTNLTLSGTTLNCTATGGGGSGGLDPNSSVYPPFTVGANDDEFDDGSFSGWTAVNDGSNVPTVTETNNVASLYVPGGHAAADLAAYMKSYTPSAGDTIEACFRGNGAAGAFNIAGLVMSDGTTYGAGSQAIFYYSPQEAKWYLNPHTNFSTAGTLNAVNIQQYAPAGDMFMRLEYDAANSFRGWVSPDGVSWVDVTGAISVTLTPTRIGFFVTTWGSSTPFVWSFRYFRKV